GHHAQHKDRQACRRRERDLGQERRGSRWRRRGGRQGPRPSQRIRRVGRWRHRCRQGAGGRPLTSAEPFRKANVPLLTREYPPDVYGGAGVHVEYLARELRNLVDLTVHCQGSDRPGAVAHRAWDALAKANSALGVLSADLSMVAAIGDADIVHSHTWY